MASEIPKHKLLGQAPDTESHRHSGLSHDISGASTPAQCALCRGCTLHVGDTSSLAHSSSGTAIVPQPGGWALSPAQEKTFNSCSCAELAEVPRC